MVWCSQVLEASRVLGLERVVHIGSCQTVHPSGEFYSESVRRPDGTLYAVTKRLQEEMCVPLSSFWGVLSPPSSSVLQSILCRQFFDLLCSAGRSAQHTGAGVPRDYMHQSYCLTIGSRCAAGLVSGNAGPRSGAASTTRPMACEPWCSDRTTLSTGLSESGGSAKLCPVSLSVRQSSGSRRARAPGAEAAGGYTDRTQRCEDTDAES